MCCAAVSSSTFNFLLVVVVVVQIKMEVFCVLLIEWIGADLLKRKTYRSRLELSVSFV